MPALTRDEMHIKLDVELEAVQSSQFNYLDPPVKDIWFNLTINNFIQEVIDSANRPNPSKRLPAGVVLYKDVISKYNAIHTLIKDKPLIEVPYITIAHDEIGDITLEESSIIGFDLDSWNIPNVIQRFTKNDRVRILGLTATNGVTPIEVSGWGVVTNSNAGYLEVSGFTLDPSYDSFDWVNATIAIYSNQYRFYTLPSDIQLIESSYAEVALKNCSSYKFVPNLTSDTYDIITLSNDPYIKKTGCLLTTYVNGQFKVDTYGLYDIKTCNLIYIKQPALVSATTNCDLPANVHEEIVKRTAQLITAYNNPDNYRAMATENQIQDQ